MKKIFSESDIPDIAREIIEIIVERHNKDGATFVALQGDLGAGKTTLTQAMARVLGITENVISPTYVIIKKYPLPLVTDHSSLFTNLIHIDAYRIEDPDELTRLGWQELISDPRNLIILEWPERVEKLIPANAIKVFIEHSGKERSIDIK